MDNCSICCETLTLKQRIRVECVNPNCKDIICRQCFMKYIISYGPNCMFCSAIITDEKIYDIAGVTFLKSTFRESQSTRLFDIAYQKLPTVMPLIENEINKEKYSKLINENKQKIHNLKLQMQTLSNQNYNYMLKINNLNKNPKSEQREFIMACSHNDCKGYISKNYKCGLCNNYTCSKCFCPKFDNHACNQQKLLNSIRLAIHNVLNVSF